MAVMTASVVPDAAAEEAARGLLHDIGQRVTKPRVAVLSQIIAAGHEHLSAEVLLDHVTANHADVHKATVYRTLDSLTEAGVLSHVHLDRGLRAYHLAEPAGHHASHLHAQCSGCGRVVDLPPDVLGQAGARIEAATGFQLDASHTALSGNCRACATFADKKRQQPTG
jgi:Fur family ferric uptake transcriptional regulator